MGMKERRDDNEMVPAEAKVRRTYPGLNRSGDR